MRLARSRLEPRLPAALVRSRLEPRLPAALVRSRPEPWLPAALARSRPEPPLPAAPRVWTFGKPPSAADHPAALFDKLRMQSAVGVSVLGGPLRVGGSRAPDDLFQV